MEKACTFKTLVAMAAIALLLVGVPALKAGEYHTGNLLYCYECHVMHSSQQHTYTGVSGSGSPTSTPPQAVMLGGPNDYLLRQAGSNVCLSCHDARSNIPDVRGTDTNSTPNGGRQAGAVSSTDSNYEDWKGHTLSTTSVTPPGGTEMTNGLRCYDCHEAHGSASHRNLDTTNDTNIVTYAASTTPENTNYVRYDMASVPAVGSRISLGLYSRENIYFNNPGSGNSAYGEFCGICHGDFHGTGNTGTDSPFSLHPTEDVAFIDTGGLPPDTYEGRAYQVQVMMANNGASVTDYLGGLPTCVSCHKAHGNQNAFGLLYMVQTGATGYTEEGTDATSTNPSVPAEARDLCRTCHTQ